MDYYFLFYLYPKFSVVKLSLWLRISFQTYVFNGFHAVAYDSFWFRNQIIIRFSHNWMFYDDGTLWMQFARLVVSEIWVDCILLNQHFESYQVRWFNLSTWNGSISNCFVRILSGPLCDMTTWDSTNRGHGPRRGHLTTRT